MCSLFNATSGIEVKRVGSRGSAASTAHRIRTQLRLVVWVLRPSLPSQQTGILSSQRIEQSSEVNSRSGPKRHGQSNDRRYIPPLCKLSRILTRLRESSGRHFLSPHRMSGTTDTCVHHFAPSPAEHEETGSHRRTLHVDHCHECFIVKFAEVVNPRLLVVDHPGAWDTAERQLAQTGDAEVNRGDE